MKEEHNTVLFVYGYVLVIDFAMENDGISVTKIYSLILG